MVTSLFLSWAQFGYYIVAMLAVVGALFTYRENSRRETARWMLQLYEKFYEGKDLKTMREALDCEPDEYHRSEIAELVRAERPPFTDYLNFFELLGFLVESKQISKSNLEQLFEYYLRKMKGHKPVMDYINDPRHGFEQLRKLMKDVKP
jgi:hypothetical protein